MAIKMLFFVCLFGVLVGWLVFCFVFFKGEKNPASFVASQKIMCANVAHHGVIKSKC